MRRFTLIALLLAMPSIMTAQRMGVAHFSGRPVGFNRPGFSRSVAVFPVPFFDSFYSGYSSDAAYPASTQPIVFMMQAAATPAAPDPAPVSQPLMIELQGDRYVQVSGNAAAQPQTIDRIPSDPVVRPAVKTAPIAQGAPAILVFRDGHRQEVSSYTIADGSLYASADYYTGGAWNQKIALASLNVTETVATNQSRGVQFRLPTAPNEVIVGP